MQKAKESVLQKSTSFSAQKVQGYDFNTGLDYSKLLSSYSTTGYQSTLLSTAISIINYMLRDNVTIYLGYTSNLVSSGLRDVIRYLVEHKLVHVLVSTAGGIEEDLIKCLGPTYLHSFDQSLGSELRQKGLNRVGNLIIPNDNYCKFEDWVMPILDTMLQEQQPWTPSKVIKRLGQEIDNQDSIYYWAQKNDINVYCPALTDGSLGDMLYFHTFKHDNPLQIDIVGDIRSINDTALHAKKTGVIILGGGVIKHHILNANLMRNGADYAVFINTGQEFDGSDAGARPDEAVSWGKIKKDGKSVKVNVDATLVFPLIVAETFFKFKETRDKEQQQHGDQQQHENAEDA